MKKNILVILLVSVFLSGCIDFQTKDDEGSNIVCNLPYIQVGDDCCLDKNSNKICDNDENSITTTSQQNQIICNQPYIQVGVECCLDQNSNNICDKHEITDTTYPMGAGDSTTSQPTTTILEKTEDMSTTTLTSTSPTTTQESTSPLNIECQLPAILVGNVCCIDANSNGYCDTSELSPQEICGNSICESGESSNCCDDCPCPTGKFCGADNTCQILNLAPFNFEMKILEICGNGNCGDGETKTNCCDDCGCDTGKTCVDNECQTSTIFQFKPIEVVPLLANPETEISEGTGNKFPVMDGNKVVWIKYFSSKPEVMIFDLTTRLIKRITEDDYIQQSPKISGNHLVWEDYRRPGQNYDLFYYNMASKMGSLISPRERPQYDGNIYGDRIVWVEAFGNEGKQDVYMFDISEAKETRITNNVNKAEAVATWGDWVVWNELRASDWDSYNLKAYQVSKKKTTNLIEGASKIGWDLDVDQDKIAYIYGKNQQSQIFIYDLNRKLTNQITHTSSKKEQVKIQGTRVVWIDERNGNKDVYMYDVGTSEEKQVTNTTHGESSPDIYGNTIVYERTGKIYKYTI